MQEQNQNETTEHSASSPKVEVTLNNHPHHIFPGPNYVETLKEILGVPSSDIFERIVDGETKSLEDNTTVIIIGGELFLSRLREHKVEVTVDHEHDHVFPGPYIVSTFKEIVHVPPSKVLEQVVAGELKLLEDTETIVIRGGEVFLSHVRTGGSSK